MPEIIKENILLALCLLSVFCIFMAIRSYKKRNSVVAHMLNTLDEFEFTQEFNFIKNIDNTNGVAVDENRKKVALLNWKLVGISAVPEIRVFHCSDIHSAELFIDGESYTKTVRSSQLIGGVVGGIALGGLGFVVGALSGTKKNIERCTDIDVRLIVNDTNNPVHDLKFFAFGGKKSGFLYDTSLNSARHWQALISVLIKNADDLSLTKDAFAENVKPSVSSGPADEIQKLGGLLNAGLISQDEFNIMKSKIIN